VSRPHLVRPADRTALRDLEFLARTTVEGLRQGLHRSPFHGYSAEFSQYRHYRPGDDLKYVDWKAFARTDRLYSRQFRETTNLAALFVIDVSRSMDFGAPQTKFALAAAVAAALGTLVIDQGDAAGLLAVTDTLPLGTEYVPPRSGRHHLRSFMGAIARLVPSGAEPIANALTRAATLMRRRGLIVVLSDLYDEDAAMADVRRLTRMGHDVIVIHTLAREELTLPAGSSAQYEDVETGARVIANPAALRPIYDAAVREFLSRVQRAAQGEGVDYVRLVAGEPIEPPLRRLLLSRRGAN
jgi:uncharacterized protein (DUF58 family)